MDLEQLKIFMAVVEQGSFTRAAEALYISHSTISRRVSALEESLQVVLLIRNSRSVRMTKAGELLYREGRELLTRAEALRRAVQSAAAESAEDTEKTEK